VVDIEEDKQDQNANSPPENTCSNQNDSSYNTKRLQASMHTLASDRPNGTRDEPVNNSFNDLKEPPAFVPERLSRMSKFDGP
jgi:hypothetical protein